MSDGSEVEKTPRGQTARQVFLRGLAISLPAILTIVILLWLLGGINDYIIQPTTDLVKLAIAQVTDRSIDLSSERLVRLEDPPSLKYVGENYLVDEDLAVLYEAQRERNLERANQIAAGSNPAIALDAYFDAKERDRTWLSEQAVLTESPEVFVPLNGRGVPYPHYAVVARDTPAAEMPASVTRLYMEYVVRRKGGSAITLSIIALALVIVAIYFLGRFVSVRLGSWFVSQVENRLLGRLPVIRNVYGSAKQVTDFLFSENQVEYRRVVAIEYPRRGIWSLALVTGEGMIDITSAVGEPCVSVLVPSSPMPVTGYTMCLPRSAVLDVDITVDQAFQFCISCGVLVPPQQKVTPELLQRELTRRLAERMQESPTDRRTLTLPPTVTSRDDDDEGQS